MDIDIYLSGIEMEINSEIEKAERQLEDCVFDYRMAILRQRAISSMPKTDLAAKAAISRSEITNCRNRISDLESQKDELKSFRERLQPDGILAKELQVVLFDELGLP